MEVFSAYKGCSWPLPRPAHFRIHILDQIINERKIKGLGPGEQAGLMRRIPKTVDFRSRREDSCGKLGQVRPRRSVSDEEAHARLERKATAPI